jgi:hypothetical protein
MSYFSTILIAALQHPDKSFREHLVKKIDLWINSKNLKHDKQSIENSINQCKGTLIEPFILGGIHLYSSILLSMLAFTKEENQKVVRLISQDAYGADSGGCLLKDDLTCTFHENFYKGEKPTYNKSDWSLCPWRYPKMQKKKITSNLTFSEHGYKIKINKLNFDLLNWINEDKNYLEHHLVENLELNSVIIPEDNNLVSLGCRIRIEKNALVIETRSTDEMVKMSVYFMRESILILDPGRDYLNRTVIAIKLLPAISENVELLTTLAFSGNDYGGWINYDCKDSPRIDDSEKIEIMKFINPPLEWIEPKLMSHL